VKNDVSYLRLILQLLRQVDGKIALAIHYRLSRWWGTQYHKDIDFICSQLINVPRQASNFEVDLDRAPARAAR
jgi:hypothetical protein